MLAAEDAGAVAVAAGAGIAAGALGLEAWAAEESASAGTFMVPVAIGAVVFDAVETVVSVVGADGGVICAAGDAVGVGATTVGLGVGAYFSTVFKKASASVGGGTCPLRTE